MTLGQERDTPPSDNRWRTIRRFLRHRGAVAGAILLLLISIGSLAAPLISPYDPADQDLRNRLQPPNRDHPFGTDNLGRDLLSRVLWGSRVSLTVGPVATVIALSLGLVMGSLAGFFGGTVDILVMRVVDVVMCLPAIFLILVIIALLGPSIATTTIVIGLVYWTTPARIIRAEFLALRQREFVEAARAIGANNMKIIRSHVLPNALAPIIVQTTLFVAAAILIEAALSYLGLGAQPPQPSWGNILTGGARVLHRAWWVATFPGIMIFVTVLSLNLVGDGLRDALDPRQHRS